jgi:hypothetical protein
VKDNAPLVHYEINGHAYNKGYYTVDGIYPHWSTLVKTICAPEEEKMRGFPRNKRFVWKHFLQAHHNISM